MSLAPPIGTVDHLDGCTAGNCTGEGDRHYTRGVVDGTNRLFAARVTDVADLRRHAKFRAGPVVSCQGRASIPGFELNRQGRDRQIGQRAGVGTGCPIPNFAGVRVAHGVTAERIVVGAPGRIERGYSGVTWATISRLLNVLL